MNEPISAGWGSGDEYGPDKQRRRAWFDVRRRKRASTPEWDHSQFEVDFSDYVPWREWLGDKDAIAAFPQSLSSLNNSADRDGEIHVPPTEWSLEDTTTISLDVASDGASDATFDLPYDNVATRDAMLAAMSIKWQLDSSDADKQHWIYSSAFYQTVDVGNYANALHVMLRRNLTPSKSTNKRDATKE